MKIRNILILLFIMIFQFGHTVEKKISTPKEDVSRYLNGRIQSTDKRYPSFLEALKLLQERNVKVIVETGTARYGDQQFVGDGGSTIIFGDWATRHHATLNSIDHDPVAIDKAKSVTKDYAEHINFCLCDSVNFLEEFSQPIDFLYLDSYVYDTNDPIPSQTHHLNEIKAAYPVLHEKSIVMIDDCDLPHGGQGKLVIEYLTEHGWKIVFKGCQTILTKDE